MSFKDHGIGSDNVSYTKNGKRVFDAEYYKMEELAKEEYIVIIHDFETDCKSGPRDNVCWILFSFQKNGKKYKTCTTSKRIIEKLIQGREQCVYPIETAFFMVKLRGARTTYDVE